ncbi:MATE family efflux transporter [Novosphingobium colocasiae]|uniref:Multidrug-efflux transporter n=3 Tax=Bacteria TaxID=2 RepID=A0A918PJ42_9SPHN|nr:MATE family efflux transporter [Novosphingobium colocasiae]
MVWTIAVPAMLTNLATALFGLADMWTIGRLGDAAAQGGVELGAKYMFGLLGVFNFLRTSTVALTAQAVGGGDREMQAATLARAFVVALGIGALLVLAMPLSIPFGLGLLAAGGAVHDHAQQYIEIRYWAAPAWLVNCALTGWLIGQRRVRAVLVVEVSANVLHIALDLLFVIGLHFGVAGVAMATLCSELLKFAALAGIVLCRPEGRAALGLAARRATWHRRALLRLFSLNRDLFLRTVLMTLGLLLFARVGAQQGATTLAANGILFQLLMLSTLILDGFESAAQVLCGEALGARSRDRFLAVLRATMLRAAIVALALAAIYALAGGWLAALFSTDPAVVAQCMRYVGWVAVLTVVGVVSYVFDGVFVGAGWTRAMLLTMMLALLAYLAMLWLVEPFGNAGLWAAYGVMLLLRGGGQAVALPALIRSSFGGRPTFSAAGTPG